MRESRKASFQFHAYYHFHIKVTTRIISEKKRSAFVVSMHCIRSILATSKQGRSYNIQQHTAFVCTQRADRGQTTNLKRAISICEFWIFSIYFRSFHFFINSPNQQWHPKHPPPYQMLSRSLVLLSKVSSACACPVRFGVIWPLRRRRLLLLIFYLIL